MIVIQFAASSRKHGISKDRIRSAIENATSIDDVVLPKGSDGWFIVGMDDDGVELEIVADVRPDGLYVIHAMINRG